MVGTRPSNNIKNGPLASVRVQVDQKIHLSVGWEPQDDVLSMKVKVVPTDKINSGGRNDYKRYKVKRGLRTNEKSGNPFFENRTGQVMADEASEWATVEELRGDEIESTSGVTYYTRKGQRHAMTFGSKDIPWDSKLRNMKEYRRHRRDEISEQSDMAYMGDCVLDGKSIRMKKHGTIEDQREKEILAEEEGKVDRPDVGNNEENLRGMAVPGSDGRGRGHMGNHVVAMVESGSEARMACHECPVRPNGRGVRSQQPKELEKEGKTSILWYRLSRVKERRHFKIQEVSLDMHDDKSRDRVYVTRDHTLVFTNTRTHDGGSYFCKSPEGNSDVTFKESVPEKEISTLFKNPKVRYFYHLDVLNPSQEDAILVSAPGLESSSQPAPSPPVNITDMNVRVFTDWQEWGLCSICDRPGTRRRVGQCMVTRLDHNKTASPVFLDAVLSAYEGGVPCRSSLLHGHEMLQQHISKPEEVIQEECNVTCAIHHAQLVMSASGFLGGSGNSQQNVLKQKKFRESEGDHVTLKCQKTSVDKAVAWINGSRVLIPTHLKESTRGRVWVDEHNSLHIKHALPQDASSYVCLVQGQVKGFVRLDVKAKPGECKVCRYARYLAFTYPFNFVIYIIIVYARHQEKKRTLNYDLLPVGSSSSSSSSMDENPDDSNV